MPSKGYTSSFRGSSAPSSYAEVLSTDFGTFGSPNVNLGTAGYYAVLGGSGVTNSGNTVVTGGNVGSSPTPSITGFPPGAIIPPAGIDNSNAGSAHTAQAAAVTFYTAYSVSPQAITTADLGTQSGNGGATGTYRAGKYTSPSSIAINTPIILDAQGNPNAVFVFYATGSTITQAIAGTITLVNGAKADNVIWLAGSSWSTTGPGAVTVGTILAVTSITLGGGTLVGHALAGSGAVTISTATTITAEPPTAPSIQNPLPLVPANGTADYIFVIPNSGSQWRNQKSVQWARPLAIAETAGIAIDGCDIISPVYPGVNTAVTAGIGPTAYMSLNGYVFQATTSGTTAATFIGFSKFNTTKGATTTDGTVVWTSQGKAVLIQARFANSSATAATPVATEYDFFTI